MCPALKKHLALNLSLTLLGNCLLKTLILNKNLINFPSREQGFNFNHRYPFAFAMVLHLGGVLESPRSADNRQIPGPHHRR